MRYKEISAMGKTKTPSLPLTSAILVIFLSCPTVVPAAGGDPGIRQSAWVEPDVDRPGSDFKILWHRGGVEACQEACAQNSICKSYTYVREGVAGRMEGCWLKDDVPPPVEDGCCVSGVKASEAVSRVDRKPVLPRGEAPKPPTGPDRQAKGPKPPVKKPEQPREKIPETGRGRREAAGLNFAAAPPRTDEKAMGVLPAALALPAAETGAGRREAAGMDFSAAPLPTAGWSGAGPGSKDAPATGVGRKEVEGVHYEASPPSIGRPVTAVSKTGAGMRKITGVGIKAVPPPR
jgi:hypothetical protein